MKIKLILFGEAVAIPHTSIGLGLGLITVFIDNNGFTTASNDLGSLGYVLIQTSDVDLGQVDAGKQALFADLTNRIVSFVITPNLFVKSGGLVHISMTIGTEDAGVITNHTLEYIAEDCTGIALVTSALSFTANMSPLEKTLAELDGGEVVAADDVVEMRMRRHRKTMVPLPHKR